MKRRAHVGQVARAGHLLAAIAAMWAACGSGADDAAHRGDSGASAALPACANGATPLMLSYMTADTAADCNLFVREFSATAASLTGFSRATRTTHVEFRWREKACMSLVLSLVGDRPAVDHAFALAPSGPSSLTLEERECGENDDGKLWRVASGSARVTVVEANRLGLEVTAAMAAAPGQARGTFTLAASLRSDCFVDLP